MGSCPSVKVRWGTLNSSDMTRWYVDPSTRDLVVRSGSGVSSSIQEEWTRPPSVEMAVRRLSGVVAFIFVVCRFSMQMTLFVKFQVESLAVSKSDLCK
mmetsp:Transcript_7427/g.12247  ORF Transcript_7427/g.12247 Transcript_7427/m.12247 type:complete len:98 (+) Transcript_7427:1549-1842(+)